MSTTQEIAENIIEKLPKQFHWRAKKMFGEYGICCEDCFVGVICDNQFFLKITARNKDSDIFDRGTPYKGAKESFLVNNFSNKNFIDFIQNILLDIRKK
ncbi:TfoX/Sxy family protein (plasmid) [Lactococcus garvieae]|nr:TfoX/Sxy family protein [Lactococcus garvieae]CEF52420.1 hypothetical protein LGMT14_02352 [Lactococcus garvieae]